MSSALLVVAGLAVICLGAAAWRLFVREPGDVAASPAGSERHVRPAHVIPLVAAAPADDPDLAAAETTAIAWLRRADAARRADAVPLPYPLLMAVEAAASTWIDDPRVTPTEIFATLAPGGTEGDGPVVARLWALDRALRLGPIAATTAVADAAFTELVSRGAEHLGGGQPVAGTPRAGAPLTLAHAVSDAADLAGRSRYGSLGGAVSRVVLSTWPARIGLVAGVPLVVSPSLTRPVDAAARGALAVAPDPGSDQRLLLTVVADAARRHVLAARAHARGRATVADELAAMVPSTLLVPLTTVLARVTVLTADDVSGATGLTPSGAAELLGRLEEAGVLRRGGISAEGQPLWVAPAIVDPVLELFARPGLAEAPAPGAAAAMHEEVGRAGSRW